MGKKEKTLLVLMLLSLILIVGTMTYAFFSAGVSNDKKQEVSVTTGDMVLTFADGSPTFSAVSLTPGASVTKTFTIENTGSLDATARIKWKDLINSYLPVSLTYTFEYSTASNGEYEIIDLGNVPQSIESTTQVLYENIYVPANTKLYYNLTITLENLEEVDQTADLNASMSSYFELEATHYDALKAVATSPDGTTPFLGGTVARSEYEAVYTVDHINVPNTASSSWDVSYLQNGSVMAWDMDSDEDGKPELYIGQNGGVIANPDSRWLFSYFYPFTEIDLSNLDTSKVWNMEDMFNSLSIESGELDLSNWDTSNVVNCHAFSDIIISSLNLSNWDLSKVTNMSYMFSEVQIGNLDVSNWNTSNVTDMSGMFSLSYINNIVNINDWDTSNVTNMGGMFEYATDFASLDLSTWDTSNVTDMSYMFIDTIDLRELDLGNWDTSKVTEYRGMFSETGLESITINQKSESFIRARLTEADIWLDIIVVS